MVRAHELIIRLYASGQRDIEGEGTAFCAPGTAPIAPFIIVVPVRRGRMIEREVAYHVVTVIEPAFETIVIQAEVVDSNAAAILKEVDVNHVV